MVDNDEIWEKNSIIARLFKSGRSLWAICSIFENYEEDALREEYREVAKRLAQKLKKLFE